MRLRNVKNKEDILNSSDKLVKNPKDYRGNWNQIFGNNNPIYIEIGMGKGDFIIQNALKYPNINFIGIEKFDSVIARAIQKVPNDLNNLFLIRMDALDIESIFDKEINRIYLNFSDPWPKKRHWDRRLTSRKFLQRYDNIFKKNPEIIQKTDNVDLFQYSVVSLSQYGYKIEQILLDLHSNTDIDNITTEYEHRFSSQGIKILYLSARK